MWFVCYFFAKMVRTLSNIMMSHILTISRWFLHKPIVIKVLHVAVTVYHNKSMVNKLLRLAGARYYGNCVIRSSSVIHDLTHSCGYLYTCTISISERRENENIAFIRGRRNGRSLFRSARPPWWKGRAQDPTIICLLERS